MPMNRVQFQPGLSMAEFLDRYGSEAQCEAALVAARWPDGFVCPACGAGGVRRGARSACGPGGGTSRGGEPRFDLPEPSPDNSRFAHPAPAPTEGLRPWPAAARSAPRSTA